MIEQADHRAKEYWLSDGIPALVFGAAYIVLFLEICACLALLYLIPHVGSNWLWFFNSAFVASPVAIFLSVAWFGLWQEDIIEFIKSRTTYPRTGYVAPPSYWTEEGQRRRMMPPNTLLRGCSPVDRSPPVFESRTWPEIEDVVMDFVLDMAAGHLPALLASYKTPMGLHCRLGFAKPRVLQGFRQRSPLINGNGPRASVLLSACLWWSLAFSGSNIPLWHGPVFVEPGVFLMLGGAIELTRYLRRNPVPRT